MFFTFFEIVQLPLFLTNLYSTLIFRFVLFSFQGTNRLTALTIGKINELIFYGLFANLFLISLRDRGGDEENRTPDPLLARQVLSQLSYTPI